jgi:hypothetical protein
VVIWQVEAIRQGESPLPAPLEHYKIVIPNGAERNEESQIDVAEFRIKRRCETIHFKHYY